MVPDDHAQILRADGAVQRDEQRLYALAMQCAGAQARPRRIPSVDSRHLIPTGPIAVAGRLSAPVPIPPSRRLSRFHSRARARGTDQTMLESAASRSGLWSPLVLSRATAKSRLRGRSLSCTGTPRHAHRVTHYAFAAAGIIPSATDRVFSGVVQSSIERRLESRAFSSRFLPRREPCRSPSPIRVQVLIDRRAGYAAWLAFLYCAQIAG